MEINKIVLSYLEEKIINIDIDFIMVKHFEIKGITQTISHNTNGELIDFWDANDLELLLFKGKLSDEILNSIKKIDNILSVGVILKNGNEQYYNFNEKINVEMQKDIVKIII